MFAKGHETQKQLDEGASGGKGEQEVPAPA